VAALDVNDTTVVRSDQAAALYQSYRVKACGKRTCLKLLPLQSSAMAPWRRDDATASLQY